MKIKKWLLYILIVIALLAVLGVVLFNRTGLKIYGGLTEKVDHTQFKPQQGTFIISNVNVLSAEGDKFIPGQSVLIHDGQIQKIAAVVNYNKAHVVINGTAKYLIPGLIDSHVHLFKSPNDLLLYIANGVTGIRELIGEADHLQWKNEIENGRLGPKMFVATPRLGSFEAIEGWFMEKSQGFLNVENAEDATTTLKALYEEGYDGVKIYSQLNNESYKAITKLAKTYDMPTFGHIPWDVSLAEVWESGQSGIAHFEELMNALSREFSAGRNIGSFGGQEEAFLAFVEERSEGLATNLIESDIAVTSTLWLTESFAKQPFNIEKVLRGVELEYENPGISEWVSFIPQGLGWLPSVNRYRLPENLNAEQIKGSKKYWDTYVKACQLLAYHLSMRGVKIMAGTDANLPPTVPGFSLHDELQSLYNAGISTAQVLKSATTTPAEWLQNNSGKILPGYRANLVLLNENPLDDISNTKSINTVINRGKVFDRNLLDKMLSSVKEANDRSRKVDISEYTQRQ